MLRSRRILLLLSSPRHRSPERNKEHPHGLLACRGFHAGRRAACRGGVARSGPRAQRGAGQELRLGHLPLAAAPDVRHARRAGTGVALPRIDRNRGGHGQRRYARQGGRQGLRDLGAARRRSRRPNARKTLARRLPRHGDPWRPRRHLHLVRAHARAPAVRREGRRGDRQLGHQHYRLRGDDRRGRRPEHGRRAEGRVGRHLWHRRRRHVGGGGGGRAGSEPAPRDRPPDRRQSRG